MMRTASLRIALAVVLIVTASTGAAVAASTTNATSSSDVVTQGVGADLGPTTLQRWTYNPETGALKLHLRSDHATRITTTDSGAANREQMAANGPGGARTPSTGHNIQGGEDTVTIYPTTYDGGDRLAVTVGTTGDGWRLWTDGLPTGDRPPIPYGAAQALVLGAIACAVALTILVARRRQEPTEDAWRLS